MEKPSVNLPDYKIPRTPHTAQDILDACAPDNSQKERLSQISKELMDGLHLLTHYPRSVSMFGSARFDEKNTFYQKAERIGARIAQELGYAVITGGGPGIMEAGNRGAHSVGGGSVAFTIALPEEQRTNPYVDAQSPFHHFFTRKVALAFSAEAYIYFPGGFGTMDEFFELVTLIQTRKIPRVPIILVGKEFWGPIDQFFKHTLAETYGTIDMVDTEIYTITDDEDEVVRIVKEAPLRKE